MLLFSIASVVVAIAVIAKAMDPMTREELKGRARMAVDDARVAVKEHLSSETAVKAAVKAGETFESGKEVTETLVQLKAAFDVGREKTREELLKKVGAKIVEAKLQEIQMIDKLTPTERRELTRQRLAAKKAEKQMALAIRRAQKAQAYNRGRELALRYINKEEK